MQFFLASVKLFTNLMIFICVWNKNIFFYKNLRLCKNMFLRQKMSFRVNNDK